MVVREGSRAKAVGSGLRRLPRFEHLIEAPLLRDRAVWFQWQWRGQLVEPYWRVPLWVVRVSSDNRGSHSDLTKLPVEFVEAQLEARRGSALWIHRR